MNLTFARLTEILNLNRGGDRPLVAYLEDKTVFIDRKAYDASPENFMFHASDTPDAPQVDSLADAFREILRQLPSLAQMHVWVEVEGVAYQVADERVGANGKMVLMVLEPESAVRP